MLLMWWSAHKNKKESKSLHKKKSHLIITAAPNFIQRTRVISSSKVLWPRSGLFSVVPFYSFIVNSYRQLAWSRKESESTSQRQQRQTFNSFLSSSFVVSIFIGGKCDKMCAGTQWTLKHFQKSMSSYRVFLSSRVSRDFNGKSKSKMNKSRSLFVFSTRSKFCVRLSEFRTEKQEKIVCQTCVGLRKNWLVIWYSREQKNVQIDDSFTWTVHEEDDLILYRTFHWRNFKTVLRT